MVNEIRNHPLKLTKLMSLSVEFRQVLSVVSGNSRNVLILLSPKARQQLEKWPRPAPTHLPGRAVLLRNGEPRRYQRVVWGSGARAWQRDTLTS